MHIHCIVDPLTSPPTHKRSVQTTSPFIPINGFVEEFEEVDAEPVVAELGGAVDVCVDITGTRLVLASSPLSPSLSSLPWEVVRIQSALKGRITHRTTILWISEDC